MSEERARIVAVEVDASVDDRDGVVDRRASVSPFDLPRLLGNVLGDIRTIAEGMATLPKLLAALNSIEDRVDTLNEEVHRMRTRVDSMAGDVGEARAALARVEPHLEDVTNVVHPFRRIGGRARRRDQSGEA